MIKFNIKYERKTTDGIEKCETVEAFESWNKLAEWITYMETGDALAIDFRVTSVECD